MRNERLSVTATLLDKLLSSAADGVRIDVESALLAYAENDRERLRRNLAALDSALQTVIETPDNSADESESLARRFEVAYGEEASVEARRAAERMAQDAQVAQYHARLAQDMERFRRNPIESLAGVLGIPGPIPVQNTTLLLRSSETPRRAERDETGRRSLERRLNDVAEDILYSADVLRPPVDLRRIARHLGVLLVEENLHGQTGMEGCFLSSETSGGILINTAVAFPGRRRFTLGHEVGHAALHAGSGINVFQDGLVETKEFEEALEREANIFAACVLMPTSIIQRYYRPTLPARLAHVHSIASACQVSTQAAMHRVVRMSEMPSVFLVIWGGQVRWAVASPQFDGTIAPGTRVPVGTLAEAYSMGTSSETAGGFREHSDAGYWHTVGRRHYSIVEESSYRTGSGWIYTILTFRG